MSSTRSGTFTTCSLSGSSGTATCTSTYTPGAGSEGSITLTASYAGDTAHSGSSSTTAVTSTIRSSSTSLLCTPFPDAVGAPATCTATISDSSAGNTFTPTGTVTFIDSPASSGTFSSTTCTLSGGACSVSYTPSIGNEGSISISGVYGGDTDHTGSSSTFSLSAVPRTTSTTFTCNSTEVLLNQVTTCTATVSDVSGGTKITPSASVSFQDVPASSGTFSSTTCNPTGSGGTASCSITYQPSLLGLHTLFGNYTGEADLSASSGSIAVNSYDFTIIVTPSLTALRGSSATYTVTLRLVAGSTGTIPAEALTVLGLPSDATFSFSPVSKVPTSGGANATLTVNTASGSTGSLGDFSFTVVGSDPSASGGSHSASSSIGIYDYSITIAPSSEAILRGDQATYTVSVSLVSGSTTVSLPGTILLSLTGVPVNSTITLASPVAFPSSSVTATMTPLTITTSGSTPGGTFSITVTGDVGTGSRTGSASLTVRVPSITLNLSSGIVGVTVTVSGSNFAASSNITITFGSSTAAVTTSDVSGVFSASFTVPSSIAGSHTVAATDSSHSGQAIFTVIPSIALSPTSGTAGTSVTVSGTGFGSSSTITIKYDGTTQPTTPTTVTTSSTGSFSATFSVPGSSTNGAHTVTATDASSNSATSTFNVIASITLNPTSGIIGSTVAVSGTGYAASSTITIKYDGTIVATSPTTITTSGGGSFSATFTVPASTNSGHTVTATDASSHTASATFTVVASITLTPTSGQSGSSFSITGFGFSASSTITVKFDSNSIGTSSTGATGGFTVTLTVPVSTNGAHTVTATDAFSHLASSTFAVVPGITLSPTSGAVSSLVTVSGTGFTASSTVTITFGSLTVATVATDSNGLFTATFNVPASTFGAHTVTAVDSSSQSASATFSIAASITLSPTGGSVGTTVTVSGTGFAASSTMTIKYDGTTQTTLPTTVASSTVGSFSATFTVPASTNGAHTVAATDVSAHTGSAIFTISASINLNPTSGIVGSTVTVSGTGFAGSSIITVKYDGVTQSTTPTTVTSSSAGSFSATFTVPASTTGAHSVTSVDALGNTASASFNKLASVTIQITISVANGGPTGTGALNGCSVNPGTIAFDGSQHTFAALPSCTITVTVPTDGSNTRFRFAGPSASATVNTCASGTCSPATISVYYQLLNTYSAIPNTPSTWDVSLSITVTGTIGGLASATGCTINTTNGGGSVSCQGWFDYNAAVTVTSPVSVSSSERWTASSTNTFTDTTAGLTHTVNYTAQFQVSLAASPNTGGTTTPSGTTGWLNYGSTVSLTATPNTGFTFIIWTSSSASITFSPSATSNPVTATVRAGGAITANFVKGLDCFATGSSTTATITVTLTNCQNNDVILVFVSQDTASTVATMSDTAGFSYSRRTSATHGSSEEIEEWWTRATSAITVGDVITAVITLSGSPPHDSNMIAVGFAGISSGNPFDPNISLPHTSAAGQNQPTVTGVSTSNANDIIVAMVGSNGPNSDTPGGAFSLVTSVNQNGEVGSVEYETLSSTLSGATVTFDTSTTSQTHWAMLVDALVRVSTQVAQPVTITTIGTSISATISVSGCNVVPTAFSADGSQFTFAADPSCTLTFTAPSDTADARYRFSSAGVPSTTWTLQVCAAGTCTPTTNNIYFQHLQTLSYSINGGGSPTAPTYTATQLGSPFSQTLSTSATGYWIDNSASWSVTDPIAGAAGEKWQISTGTQADTGVVSSAQTMVFTYYHQYFLTVTSAQDTPTPASGWFNATSSVTESVTTPIPVSAGVQYVTTGWTGTGSVPATGGASSVTFSINAASSITWNWQIQYLLTIQTIGLPSSHPTAIYLAGASSGTASDSAAFTAWFNSGVSTGTIGLDSAVNGGPGIGYFFMQWDDSSTNNPRNFITMNSPATYTASYGTDTTPPIVTPTETPGPNANGWNNVTVTVNWIVSDPDSGVSSSSGCGTTSLSSETSATTVICIVTNGAGLTSSGSVVVRIDKTSPVVTGASSPVANSYGWNNGDVTTSFSCTDALSGVGTGPVTPQIISSEGTGQSRSATCTDRAGNVGSGTVSGVKIDKTPPVITSSKSVGPNSNGWNNVTVTVSFACTDPLSGVLSVPSNVTLAEGGGQSVTGTCLDSAGNSASTSQTNINIDLTLPTITGSASPSANTNGWNNGNVTISFTCSDTLSAVETFSSPSILFAEVQGQSATGSCTDKAGNTASATVSGINIDKTSPVISGSRSPGANSNGWNNATVTVSFTCADTLSGVFSAPSDTTLGEGGGQSVSGTCLDNAGNAASTSQTNINIDLTPPTVTASRSLLPNANGWNNVPITVSYPCSDNLSGVSSTSPSTTLAVEGSGQSTTGDCIDLAGNSGSVTENNINIDLTPPVINGSRSPDANAFGWNNATVIVSFTCTDILSGVGSSSSNITVVQEGFQSVTGTCIDQGGNSASTAVGNINIDVTPPIVTASRSVPPNTNGWNNVPVTISFSCTDALSGVFGVSNSTTLGEGQGQSATGSCSDLAGNSASTTDSNVNIDLTPPTITGALSRPPNPNGWINATDPVVFTCSDVLSGVAFCSPPAIPPGEGLGQSVVGLVMDLAGNNSTATVSNINLDETPPVVTASRSPLPNGNGWSNVVVSVSYACADPLSGVDSYSTPSILSTEGQAQSATGFCTDKAGNTASVNLSKINIDLTQPTITWSRNPPDILGGTFGPVTVTFICTDPLSGVANVTSPVTLGNGQDQSATGTCTDGAGNQAFVVAGPINVGLNTSLLLLVLLIIASALSTIFLLIYRRKRRNKFIWDIPSAQMAEDPSPKGSTATEDAAGGPS